jgi:hypothetical protein
MPFTAIDYGVLWTLCSCGFRAHCYCFRLLRNTGKGPRYFPRYKPARFVGHIS